MRFFIVLASVLASFEVKAQSDAQSLFGNGFDYFYGTKNTQTQLNPDYDSSLRYLLLLDQKFPEYRHSEVLDYISKCYFEKKDYLHTLVYGLKVLSNFKAGNSETDDFFYFYNSTSEMVGYVYQQINKFDSALIYYDYCTSKYPLFNGFCGIYYSSRQVPMDYNYFICYKALGQNKKAIAKLTPHLFDSTMNAYLDTTIVNEYEKLILATYSKSEIEGNIRSAIDSLQYNMISEMKNNKQYDFQVSCRFKIFDCEVPLLDLSFSSPQNEADRSVSKENQILRVKNSEGYKRFHFLAGIR